MTIERRKLDFAQLEDAVSDAEQLLQSGYIATGNWDLTQCCHHLTLYISYPIDGFPPAALPMRLVASVMRYTIAPGMLRKVLATRRWPEGIPTDRQSIPLNRGTDAVAVERFRSAVKRLTQHAGPWKASPLFGTLDTRSLLDLHCIHAAHHLGFLVHISRL